MSEPSAWKTEPLVALPKAQSHTKHERQHKVIFNEGQIKNLLAFAAAEGCVENFAIDLKAPGVWHKVFIEKVEVGNAGFAFQATVTITEDLKAQAEVLGND